MPSGNRKCPSISGHKQCPIIGLNGINAVSGWNSAPSMVLVGGMVPQGPEKGKLRATSGPLGHSLETTALDLGTIGKKYNLK